MPPKPIDFKNAVIYKICCADLAVKDVYVGSTTNIVKRRCGHKADCANETRKSYNLPVYQFIRDHGGFDNWGVVVVEPFPCENSEQMRTRERFFMETLCATLNIRHAIQTKQDVKEAKAKYYDTHVEEMKEAKTKYRSAHKAEIIEAGAKYYTTHAAEIKEKTAKYYVEHAAEIKKYKLGCITCQCGIEYTRGNKARHMCSANHIKALAAL